jgi:O-antigen/teichoic acid export membrane protein
MQRIFSFAKRTVPLLRLASEYTAAHMGARLLAATSGLLLVRLLPVDEYGFYTLLLAAFTFICTFSDLGATDTLSFFRWRAGKRNKSWMPYFHAVLRFRRMVFMLGFVCSAAYIFYTGLHIGEDMPTVIFGVVLIGLSAWFAIQSGIISYLLKLEQRYRQAYAVELGNEGTKLAVVVIIWVFGFATALAGLLSISLGALFAALLANKLLEKKGVVRTHASHQQARRTNRVLFKQIAPTLPGSIYFSLQGLLVTWLAAYYGSVVNVAEVGALGRLGVLIGVIAGFTSTVFVPRLLAITDEKLFLRRYLLWWLVIFSLACLIMLVVWLFPSELLFVLGESYSGLHQELLVLAATAVVGTWGGFAWNISRARGWVKYHPYSVALTIGCQIAMFYSLDFSTTMGVLLFGFGTLTVGFLYQLVTNVIGFTSLHMRNATCG